MYEEKNDHHAELNVLYYKEIDQYRKVLRAEKRTNKNLFDGFG